MGGGLRVVGGGFECEWLRGGLVWMGGGDGFKVQEKCVSV